MAARGLGKGLDALIPSVSVDNKEKNSVDTKKADQEADSIVKITKIDPNREQPRKNFDEDALQELADSIKQFGLCNKLKFLEQHKKEKVSI